MTPPRYRHSAEEMIRCADASVIRWDDARAMLRQAAETERALPDFFALVFDALNTVGTLTSKQEVGDAIQREFDRRFGRTP